MAKIKSVKLKTNKGDRRVQLGSKAYAKYTGQGATAISGTGKNLNKRDISGVGGGFTDQVSTTRAKREANAEGALLPYQQEQPTGAPTEQPLPAEQPAPQGTSMRAPTQVIADETITAGSPQAPTSATKTAPQGKYGSPVTGYFNTYEEARGAALNALSKGGEAPGERGAAMTQMAEVIPKSDDTTAIDTYLTEDKDWQAIQQQALEYLEPVRQKETLLKEYDRMYANSGIEALDQEIIDAETIIDGTEDDIRNEVQMAGGFATDSQVQAMALARNKSLLKRYNQLFAAREAAQKRLDTMMQLSAKDKEMAMERANMGFNLMFKMAEFKERAQNNVREAFNNLAKNVGYAGLYEAYKGDAKQLSMLERTMGLQQGGLKALANFKVPLSESEQADIAYKKAQTAKIYSEMGGGSGASTKQQMQVANRVEKADIVIGKVGEALNSVNFMSTGFLGGYLKNIPSSGAFTLNSAINTIKANLGFDELQEMRNASPTGGALGQVAVQELDMLQSTIASLDTGLPKDTLVQNLRQVEEHYANWLHTVGYDIVDEGGEKVIVKIID